MTCLPSALKILKIYVLDGAFLKGHPKVWSSLFVICSLSVSIFPIVTILVPFWFSVTSLLFLYLCKLFVRGLPRFERNFVLAITCLKIVCRSSFGCRSGGLFCGPRFARYSETACYKPPVLPAIAHS